MRRSYKAQNSSMRTAKSSTPSTIAWLRLIWTASPHTVICTMVASLEPSTLRATRLYDPGATIRPLSETGSCKLLYPQRDAFPCIEGQGVEPYVQNTQQ
jgi:hypothetical protein